LRNGDLPGFKLGQRYVVDAVKANKLYGFDEQQQPAA